MPSDPTPLEQARAGLTSAFLAYDAMTSTGDDVDACVDALIAAAKAEERERCASAVASVYCHIYNGEDMISRDSVLRAIRGEG